MPHRVPHGVMEAPVHQERIGPIDEDGGACQRAVERKHALTCLVDPAPARCRRIRVAGEVDELELGQLGTDVLDEFAVAKLKTQSQRVVSQICSPHALAHPLQIHRAIQAGVGDYLSDREIRIASADRDDVALITGQRPVLPVGSRSLPSSTRGQAPSMSSELARYRANAVGVG